MAYHNFYTMKPTFINSVKTGGIVFLLILTFMIWYKYKFSMDYVDTQEIHNPAEYSTHVLIATQGSEFKDAVLENVLEELTTLEYYIKVTDVSNLKEIAYQDWNAICLMHTWEQWKAPRSVTDFVESIPIPNDLIVIATSGSGNSQIPRVDGITSASNLSDVETVSNQIVNRIKSAVQETALH